MTEADAEGLVAERRNLRLTRLRELLDEGGALRLTEAARALGVSSMTVRRDLAAFGGELAVLGGHVVAPGGGGQVSRYVLDREQASHVPGKREAALHAARLVEDGDTLFVDCGTTMPYLIESLPEGFTLTVVCYALNIALLATRRLGTQVVLLGGLFHPASATFYSKEALRSLEGLGINKAFLSAGGVHPTRGASCSNFNEVPVKQAVLAQAMRCFLVADASKLGQLKPAHFASLHAFERIITDSAAGAEALAMVRQGGAMIDVAAAAQPP
ncbi:MAG: DeoR/GlpR transcriptional regulator [Acetobacteraceae bacterium]|nr:DeoR/GlpR transcriptional regulator [Acetobacteraceae bacterium]